MSSNIFKALTAIIISIISLTSFSQEHHHSGHHDMPSVHGMFMFGSDKVYLSHLPMFHSPHDYQVLLEVSLPKEVKSEYLKHMKLSPLEASYTIVPETFSLPDLVSSKKSFKATLFKGHFERGGKAISNEVMISIKKVLYFKKFEKNAFKPDAGKYIIVGNLSEQFLVHKVISKPDFDQITKLTGLSKTMTTMLLDTTHLNITIPLISNIDPVKEGQNIVGFLSDNESVEVLSQAAKQLYLEFGDLSF
jgi:hypothetical protein